MDAEAAANEVAGEGMVQAVGSVKTAFGNLKNSVSGLVDGLGLGTVYGNTGWDMSLNLGSLGVHDLPIETHFGWGLDLIRNVTLWVISVGFVFKYVRMIRDALVG